MRRSTLKASEGPASNFITLELGLQCELYRGHTNIQSITPIHIALKKIIDNSTTNRTKQCRQIIGQFLWVLWSTL